MVYFSGQILKAIFLSLLSFSNRWSDVILIFCFFNFISALLISVVLCQCHSVPLFLCPLSFSSLGFYPQTLSESLSLSAYLWISVPSFSGPPFLSLPGSPSPLLWVIILTPAGLCSPLSLHLYSFLSPSLYPFVSMLPAVCLWTLAFGYSLE